ncbi:MAG: hypothetical protein AAB411_00680 [Patescibacteria group bacterium]
MNKKIFITLLFLSTFFVFSNIASADISQQDSSCLSPSVSNVFQSLGSGLSGILTNIQLRDWRRDGGLN